MKYYFLILALLLNLSITAQEETPEGACHYPVFTPRNTFFDDLDYNHFEALFPQELLKEKGIKTVILKNEDIDAVPTINVQNDNISTYRFNSNGFLIKYEFRNRFYIYKRAENNQLISVFDSISSYTNEFNYSSISEFEYEEDDLLVSEWRTDKYVGITTENQERNFRTSYTFDDKSRVIQKTIESGFAWHDSKEPEIINYEYDEINYYRVASNVNSVVKDTIFFDEQWRPISSIKPSQGKNEIIYHNNGKIDLYRIFIFTEDLLEPEEDIGQIKFSYNAEGMLDKLIITDIDNTCELKVYYLRE